jgi:vacuolar protein sorting-associated protein 13A/C
MDFETNPVDQAADSKFSLSLRPLKAVYHARLFRRLQEFFKPPENLQLDEVTSAAAAGYESLTQYSRASMQYALDTHKTLLLDINIGAPVLLIPAPFSDSLLAMDFGHLCITSAVKPRGETAAADLNDSFYDQFTVKLTDLQVALVPGSDVATSTWAEALDSRSLLHRAATLIEPMFLELNLWQCVQPDNPDLTKIKLAGNVSGLNIRFSDQRCAGDFF